MRRWFLGPVVKEMSLKGISIFTSGGHFIQQSRMICAILVEGIIRTISAKFFDFGPVIQEEMFKDICYLQLWQSLCSAEWNHLCNFLEGIIRNFSVNLFV